MREDPETFARGVMFAVCSIRQPVERVPAMLRDIDLNGRHAEALAMPMKYFAWDYLQDHATSTWRDVCGLGTRDALLRLLAVPALGIVKSAFVLQFLGHDIGCMDTRNLRREKVPIRAFSNHMCGAPGSTGGYRSKQIDRYWKLAHGRAEALWNAWCTEVAEDRWRENTRTLTADEVSALHLEIVR